MGTLFRPPIVAALVLSLAAPASAQGERCTQNALSVDGIAIQARFCIPAGSGAPSLNVTEGFSAQGKTLSRTIPLPVVAGAQTSRTIDDVDLAPIGVKRSLHMTLTYRGGSVELEHALTIPGATPVK